jgi:hypothetical protein
MSMPLRAAPLWLWIAMGGEMPEADEPMPEPVLGEIGGVKVLLLPAPLAGAYSAALDELGAAAAALGELAPAAAAGEA